MADNVVGVVLAAGSSARMGGADKLTLRVDGEALVRRAIRPLLAARLREVLVVTRPGHLRAELANLPIRFVDNPRHASGPASSLQAAFQAAPAATTFVVTLGDLPAVPPDAVRALLDLPWAPGEVPLARLIDHDGTPGHPVLIGAGWRAAVENLPPETGARALFVAHPHRTVCLGPLSPDIDTPLDLARWTA